MVSFFDQCARDSFDPRTGELPGPSDVSSSSCASPHNSMRITLNGDALDVQVNGPYEDIAAIGFNVVGSMDGLAISNVTPGYWLGDLNVTGTFGTFDFFIYGFDGRHGHLAFTLARDIGFLTALDMFERNEYGWLAGALLSNPSGSFFEFASEMEPLVTAPVPEPASMLLLGTGLLAVWRARRRQS
jgi:hypothetical protein